MARKTLSVAVSIPMACVLFAPWVVPQDEQLACGPSNEKYRLVRHKDKPLPEASPGKAVVYVLRGLATGFGMYRGGVRLGVDGKWVGMTERRSYFYFAADPGLLKLCLDARKTEMFLTVEAGKTYYVMMEVGPVSGVRRLLAISEDEAKKRLPRYHYATAERKP
jgi:hypothetical protein